MKNGRHLIHCLLVLLATSSVALAGNDLHAANPALALTDSASCGIGATTPLLQQGNHNLYALGGEGGVSAPVTAGPAGSRHLTGLVVLQDLEGARLDDESLGRVSGGAAFFATPDVMSRSLIAIILWDEGKPRRSTTSAVPYGQTSSTISVQGR